MCVRVYAHALLAKGPPGGVQLPSGRLVQAVHGINGTYAIWSDDHGTTWKHGTNITFPQGMGRATLNPVISFFFPYFR